MSPQSWIKPLTNLKEYYLVVDENFEDVAFLKTGDSLQVEPGRRKFRIVGEFINDLIFTLKIDSNEVRSYRANFDNFIQRPNKSSFEVIQQYRNISIQTDQNSSIFIDDEYVGTHTVDLFLKPGKYKLKIIHPELGELTKTIETGIYNISYVARFNENPSKLSLAAKFVPGAEYIASKRYLKAALTYGGLSVLTLTALIFNKRYNIKLNEFNNLQDYYDKANTPQSALAYKNSALNVRQEMNDINKDITYTVIGIAAFYALSTFDSFLKPKTGYKGNFSVGMLNHLQSSNTVPAVTLKLDL